MAALTMAGAPANPPLALAAALRGELGLFATPHLLPGGGAGRWTVLFGSDRDANSALAQAATVAGVVLFGCPVRLERPGDAGEAQALRIFISGDRSQVGKSIVCLGLLSALLSRGLKPSEIAYIKPATQCEAPQLVGKFCAARGIANRPIGPIVYYSGFTRAFLAGETDTASAMLSAVTQACDELGKGRKVLIIDGVGYPAVGSITQTSNAAVAKAVGAPVLLVGKSGVGDAVDSYVLNRSVFVLASVPVLGAVFNKLADDSSYYSLENCKAAVGEWFSQAGDGQKAYGFLPQMQTLGAVLAATTAAAAAAATPAPKSGAAATAAANEAGRAAAAAGLSAEEDTAIATWTAEFCRRVDMAVLMADVKRVAGEAARRSDEVEMATETAHGVRASIGFHCFRLFLTVVRLMWAYSTHSTGTGMRAGWLTRDTPGTGTAPTVAVRVTVTPAGTEQHTATVTG